MRVHAMFAAGLLGLAPAANAQVSGTIILGGGPIGGVITIGAPVIVARPGARVVVVERPVYAGPRVIYVERWHGKGHYKHRGYARRVVYYDPRDRVYYEGHRRGCRGVEVWERHGRYYRDHDRDDRRGDRHNDRHDDWYDDRDDDRRYDRRR